MNIVEEYFSKHKTQLAMFKHAVKLFAPATLAFLIYLVSEQLTQWQFAAAALYILNMLNEKVSQLDPTKVWEGVGASTPKKKR